MKYEIKDEENEEETANGENLKRMNKNKENKE